jgi:hypothetical protein
MSCILVYYNLFGLRPPIPLILYAKRVGFKKKISISYNLLDKDSISTCLFYKIYLSNIL